MDNLGKRKKVQIASDDTLDAFNVKIKEIKIQEKEKIIQAKASSLGVPYINLSKFPISQDALKIISPEDAQKYKIICFFYGGQQIKLGAIDPFNEEVKKFVEQLKDKYYTKGFQVYLISEHSFEEAFKGYAKLPTIKEETGGVKITEEDLKKFSHLKTIADIQQQVKHLSVTELLDLILATAINFNASDIHIEAEKEDVKVRYRLDGILHDVLTLPKEDWHAFISRIKLVSHLKINVTDRPQDGSFTVYLNGEQIDIRVSTLPTAYGESVVIRILMFSRQSFTLEEVGLRGASYEVLKRGIQKPNGLILNTGPTGSGKTTTLYAILQSLNKEGTKIITVEDPVEYKMPGINQSQIDESKGYTFAKALRSLVRQDPDIIMVGEIRDFDTLDAAIQSALTGHLVLSTVHTNSAAATVPRLLSLGGKSFLLAPALNIIIGQRLVRRLCPHCRQERFLTPEEQEKIKEKFKHCSPEVKEKIDLDNLDKIKFYQAKGCEKCNNIGYKGRIGIFEVIEVDEEIKKLILSKESLSASELEKTAIRKGMITMFQDGVMKAAEAITSLEEVWRVVG